MFNVLFNLFFAAQKVLGLIGDFLFPILLNSWIFLHSQADNQLAFCFFLQASPFLLLLVHELNVRKWAEALCSLGYLLPFPLLRFKLFQPQFFHLGFLDFKLVPQVFYLSFHFSLLFCFGSAIKHFGFFELLWPISAFTNPSEQYLCTCRSSITFSISHILTEDSKASSPETMHQSCALWSASCILTFRWLLYHWMLVVLHRF